MGISISFQFGVVVLSDKTHIFVLIFSQLLYFFSLNNDNPLMKISHFLYQIKIARIRAKII